MRFRALDSWRGVAALLVMFVHLSANGAFYRFPPIRNGGLSVPFFFVLSGFVITHAYSARLMTLADTRTFMIRRFGRIYPLHLAMLILLVLLELVKQGLVLVGIPSGQAPFSGSNDLASLIANIFLLQAIIPIPDYSWNGPSWSISVEFYTYVIFALFTVSVRKSSVLPPLVMTALAAIALALIEIRYPAFKETQFRGLALCVCGFFAGHCTYRVFRKLGDIQPKLATRFECLAIVLVGTLYWFDPLDGVLTIIAFALVVLVFAFDAGAVSNVLRGQPWAFLGKISYSVYMLHFVLLSVMGGVLRAAAAVLHKHLYTPHGNVLLIDFGPPGTMDLLALVYAFAVIVLATLSYRFIETPGQRFFAVIADRQQGRAMPRAEPAAP